MTNVSSVTPRVGGNVPITPALSDAVRHGEELGERMVTFLSGGTGDVDSLVQASFDLPGKLQAALPRDAWQVVKPHAYRVQTETWQYGYRVEVDPKQAAQILTLAARAFNSTSDALRGVAGISFPRV